MEDSGILRLYFQRNPDAIEKTREKYDTYCSKIAYNVLGSVEDAQECVSDTYFKLWNSIPPSKPKCLRAFIGRVTHNVALDRYRKNKSRGQGNLAEILHEFEVVQLEEPGDILERKELANAISRFLWEQSPKKRRIFLLRYWYYESIEEISRQIGMKDTSVKTELYRIRKRLKAYLEQEGYTL